MVNPLLRGWCGYFRAGAESTIGLYKAELIDPRGPWNGVEDRR